MQGIDLLDTHISSNHRVARSDSVISKGKLSDLYGIRMTLLGLEYLFLSLSRVVQLVEHQPIDLGGRKIQVPLRLTSFDLQ